MGGERWKFSFFSWEDCWLEIRPLSEISSRLYRLSQYKYNSVKNFLAWWHSVPNRLSQGWQRILRAREESNLLQLQV